MYKRKKQTKKLFMGGCIKAALASCVLTIILVLFLALLLKWDVLQTGSIRTCNTIIKSVSAAFAGFMCARRMKERTILHGSLAGVFYVVISYALFFIFEKRLQLSYILLADLIMGAVCSGVIAAVPDMISSIKQE